MFLVMQVTLTLQPTRMSMTETLHCPVDECDQVISHESRGVAKSYLLLHAYRAHYPNRTLGEVDRDLQNADYA
jgi:hypothetical protein